MFDEDPEFRDLSEGELILMAEDGLQSVVLRGRALLEIGRRADGQPELRERLFEWIGDEGLSAKNWVGPVTLAWIVACCLGHSANDVNERVRLVEMLCAWPDSERSSLLSWAKQESWFGVSGDSIEAHRIVCVGEGRMAS